MVKRVLIVLALILLVAAGYVVKRKAESNKTEVAPKVGSVVESVYGLGTVVARQIYRVKISANLSVGSVFVEEGDVVKKGDRLVSFDEPTVIRAPFAGTITQILYKPGEVVAPHTPVLVLTDLTDLYLEVSLEQQAAMRVKMGQKAIITFESLRGEKYEGKVSKVFPSDSQFLVHLEMTKVPEGVLPGMTADVAIEVGSKERALLIPIGSVFSGKVIRVRNGQSEKVDVSFGVISGDWAEVTSSNILETDRVVVRTK